MDNITDFFDKVLALMLLPATIYGAGGAFMNAKHNGKSLRQTAIEVVGGAITTNMLAPLIDKYTPLEAHYTLFFFAGWGGLKLVSRLYEAAAQALERRIKRKIGGDVDSPEA